MAPVSPLTKDAFTHMHERLQMHAQRSSSILPKDFRAVETPHTEFPAVAEEVILHRPGIGAFG